MTEHDITEIRYWLDLGIKALIGVVVSFVGMDYRAVKQSLSELQLAKYSMGSDVAVMRVELQEMLQRMERMEKKLDRITDR